MACWAAEELFNANQFYYTDQTGKDRAQIARERTAMEDAQDEMIACEKRATCHGQWMADESIARLLKS